MTPTITQIEAAPPTTAQAAMRRVTSAWQKNRMQKWLCNSILIGLLLFVAAVILKHPLATNDGPVHVAFSHLMLTYQQPDHPLQQLAYTLHLRPNPNLAVYFLMAALMRALSPALAESTIQILCIAGPVAAGYFAFGTIQPKNAWLSIFLLPLTLNQMLFLGLYNHAISMAAFFLVIGCYFRMVKAPSWRRATALTGALILTFFCHASGFVMAYSGIGIMTATAALLALRRMMQVTPSFTAALWSALRKLRYAVAAMIIPIPVAAFFLSSGGKNPIDFGIPIYYRLDQFVKLHLLAVNYPYRDRFPAFAISALLLTGFLVAAVRILKNHPEWSHQRRDQAIGAVAATLLAILIMTFFPDTMGGGWTHYRRFQVYPYFWILITLCFENFSTLLAGAHFAIGTSTSFVLIASMVARQDIIRQQMAPLAEVDRIVGNHCSVLPLVLESHLVDQNTIPDWMDYQPYFQSASRLELSGDRVVLFNYLARLTPYPVHFRPEIEPQANIFLWKPQQIENAIEKVNLKGFESSSNMHVDYILLWGYSNRPLPAMQHQVHEALADFNLVYKSRDGWVTLYQRQSVGNNFCTANTLTSNLVRPR